jgi:hypothetical protein
MIYSNQKMKHYFITCFILILCIGSSFAQSQDTRFQQIETAKIAYISKQLELTPSEAQRFFPIYNEYRKEMHQITHSKRKNRSDFKRGQGNELEFDSKILECKKKYRELFATAIPVSKASRFFEVEREFREKLFKELEIRNRNKR